MKVLVADKLSEAGVAALSERAEVDVSTGLSKQELLEVIGGYDGVVIRSATTIDADVIAKADRLKVIARAGIGLDNVDVEAATSRGVIVCNAPQSNVISAAEHTVALMLSLARQIPTADASLRDHEWKRSSFEGTELHGKTLGIVGLGRVGVLVAQRCSGFGMKLVAYDPFVSRERAARMGIELVPTVGELCEVADVVTVHLPKTPDTVGIIGDAELDKLHDRALVVNTARGGIVDEDALYRALSEKRIRGAALDVYSTEPVTDSPLFTLPNVVVTPHLGASTTEAQDKAGTMVAESVLLALDDEFVPSAVNVQIGGGISEAVKPFMPLAETLGRLALSLQPDRVEELKVELIGNVADEDPQAITLSALKGALSRVTHEPVTFVNAPPLAEDRGIRVATLTSSTSQDFHSVLRVSAGDIQVAGTLVGTNQVPRLVEVWGFDVDIKPSDHMVFFRYSDKPGMVGIIGGALGEAQVNIAAMQVSRNAIGGEALIAMAVDSPVPADVIDSVAQRIGSTHARGVT